MLINNLKEWGDAISAFSILFIGILQSLLIWNIICFTTNLNTVWGFASSLWSKTVFSHHWSVIFLLNWKTIKKKVRFTYRNMSFNFNSLMAVFWEVYGTNSWYREHVVFITFILKLWHLILCISDSLYITKDCKTNKITEKSMK